MAGKFEPGFKRYVKSKVNSGREAVAPNGSSGTRSVRGPSDPWHMRTVFGDTRYWPKADVQRLPLNVCKRENSGHHDLTATCPLLTTKRKYRLGKFGGLFLSSSGLIRCNSIRDTVQAEHKHIPRQHNDHYPGDSEP